MPEAKEKIFWVTTLYGFKYRRPTVQLRLGDDSHQMSPAEARDLALNLMEGAEAAESDAFIYEFMQKNAKLNDENAARVLSDFRKWREEKGKEYRAGSN